ncbi:MAG: ATP-binding protein, partial [Steroidobacteraceae bacterium]
GRMSMLERARVPIDANGLSRCVQGHLVYEEDIGALDFPFPQRLAAGGLRAMVAAPLQVESRVFGVLIAARREPRSFTSSDCEFLRQVSEHMALAAHQAQLHEALQLAYEDLRTTQQAVMQQERLRVLGQMSSGIAHDINNAISPITLYADSLLETEPGLSERARGNLRTIQQASADVAATVARLREFYRQHDEQRDHGPVDLNKLMLQLRELTRARWESIPQQLGIVIDLRLQLAEGLPALQGSESEIREALTNLIFNAVDALPTGGELTLRTSASEDGHIIAEVIDTGAGMDEETSRRCLEPFFTTKGERGTGLGLAMAYGVMQRHGGEIRIDSAIGAGTTVRLAFNAATSRTAAVAETQFEVPRGLSILLVDDDPILLNSLRETLELDGHHVVTANGGQLGIDTFRSSQQTGSPGISIVITDLGMPHVDGRSVAAAVKRASPATPVVMLTGWGERLLAEGQTPPHVDRVLGKPPRLREMRRVLAELTGNARRTPPIP